MKKFLLSAFVIIVFALYVLNLRNQTSVTPSSVNSDSTNIPPVSTPQTSAPPTNEGVSKNFKDGEYTGDVTDAYYGNVQVKALIRNGNITYVQFLDYPKDRRTSVEINSRTMPILKQEAINAQSANVDVVSGATQTSEAFIQSLSSALSQAKI